MKNKHKPRGYWESWDNLQEEIKRVVKQFGHFPSQKELSGINYTGLSRAIQKHGGFNEVKEKLGYEIERAPNGYWRDFGNVKKKLNLLKRELGHFPSTDDLKEMGESGLVTAIHDYHGGYRSVREALGQTLDMKPHGYWNDWNNVVAELKIAQKKIGHFPTGYELDQYGFKSLSSAITTRHGGFAQIRKRFNQPEKTKPSGYWNHWKNLQITLEEIIDKVGDFPTQKQITQMGYFTLANAISKFGGINKVRKKMGFKEVSKTPGYWKDFSNVEKELKKIENRLGEFPSQRYLIEHEKKDLVAAIGKNHGGWSKVRERLGGEAEVKPKGYWMGWEHVEQALKEMISERGRFPTYNDFKNSEYSTLPSAIKKFHGGLDSVRERMGFVREATPYGYWKDFGNVKKVFEELETKLSHFPTQREIYESGYTGMPSAVSKYHGGINKVAEKLGKKTKQKARGFWTLPKVKKLCGDFYEEFGHFPTQKELNRRRDRYEGLNTGVNQQGGLDRLRRLMGVEAEQRPNGYWNKKKVLDEAKKIVKKFGELPNQKQLNERGYGNFVGAISKYSSFTEVRRTLGLEVKKREDGFWTEEKILEEAKRIVKEHGDLPTKDELSEMGYGALMGQIEKKGGYPYWRQKLGLELKYKPKGFWNKENTYNEARKLYEQFGKLPSENELVELGIGSLSGAACKHYRGLVNLRELLEEENAPKQRAQLESLLEKYSGES